MGEHDDIEENLREYREARDRELPADRRLLPVHKDRLMAEARRLHAPAARRSASFAFFARWATVAVPLVLLAWAGFLWLQTQATKPARRGLVDAGSRKDALKQDALAAKPATAAEKESAKIRRNEAAPTAPPVSLAAPAEARQPEPAVEGRDELKSGEGRQFAVMEESGFADARDSNTMAQFDLSGNYRGRAQSRLQADADSSRTAEPPVRKKSLAGQEAAGGRAAGEFGRFQILQSADRIVLVAADGSRYEGRLTPGAAQGVPASLDDKTDKLQKAKAEVVSFSGAGGVIGQASLVGTNRTTREVVNLIANFSVEPSAVSPGDEAAAGEKALESEIDRSAADTPSASESLVGKAGPVQAPRPVQGGLTNQIRRAGSQAVQNQVRPAQVRLLIETVDTRNKAQAPLVDAERE